MFRCVCALGFSGPTCDEFDACASAPCRNGGKCSSDGSAFQCECPPRYTGPSCAAANVLVPPPPPGALAFGVARDAFKLLLFKPVNPSEADAVFVFAMQGRPDVYVSRSSCDVSLATIPTLFDYHHYFNVRRGGGSARLPAPIFRDASEECLVMAVYGRETNFDEVTVSMTPQHFIAGATSPGESFTSVLKVPMNAFASFRVDMRPLREGVLVVDTGNAAVQAVYSSTQHVLPIAAKNAIAQHPVVEGRAPVPVPSRSEPASLTDGNAAPRELHLAVQAADRDVQITVTLAYANCDDACKSTNRSCTVPAFVLANGANNADGLLGICKALSEAVVQGGPLAGDGAVTPEEPEQAWWVWLLLGVGVVSVGIAAVMVFTRYLRPRWCPRDYSQESSDDLEKEAIGAEVALWELNASQSSMNASVHYHGAVVPQSMPPAFAHGHGPA